MPRERKEIRIHRLHIHLDVRHALRAVDNDNRTDRMRTVGNDAHIVDETEYVGYLRHCDNLRPLCNLLRNIRLGEIAVLAQIDILQHSTARLCHELPRYDIAVMLRDRNDDLIPLTDVRKTIAVRYEVQCLRRILCEYDLLRTRRTDELLRTHACPFIDICRLDRELIRAAVRVRVTVRTVVSDRADDRLRLLCRCTIVKINNGTAVHFRLQDGKIPQILIHLAFHPTVSSPNSLQSPCAVSHL